MTYSSHPFLRANENRPVHAGFDDDTTALIKALGFTPRRYAAETVIVRQGENKDRMFVVESGWGCIAHELAGGQRQILDFALKGDIVLPQFNGGGALETFVALTDLTVLVASTKTFALAAMKSPPLFSVILEALVQNGAVIAQHLTNVGRRSALGRSAHLFLELIARLERVGAVNHDSFECPLTQYDLADVLGLTPIHVNRMLRELRERKFLEFRHGHVRMIDRAGLIKFAGFAGEYVES
ncbi:Crp/Fnr family transcriptional regulator [Mesorhizobium sp. WSM4906]|uniref:Crp/Fnr family transcriptional regulator n=1 Tax=Mesorhizobium sp. WSM4906 TaxID=3038546 RepID=UPI0024178E0C|nr:Crp/Fnr family transcriptional regulator [Mesorhizobium sp. WSM4906]WFP78016.1 Crp/Fnr family transcriptional regulator [Mesorhizobium sp. WSM4906]